MCGDIACSLIISGVLPLNQDVDFGPGILCSGEGINGCISLKEEVLK